MGKRNIAVDINGMAKKHYQNIFKDSASTFFIDTQEELVDIIYNQDPASDKQVKENNKNIIFPNYKLNMDTFLKEHIENR